MYVYVQNDCKQVFCEREKPSSVFDETSGQQLVVILKGKQSIYPNKHSTCAAECALVSLLSAVWTF